MQDVRVICGHILEVALITLAVYWTGMALLTEVVWDLIGMLERRLAQLTSSDRQGVRIIVQDSHKDNRPWFYALWPLGVVLLTIYLAVLATGLILSALYRIGHALSKRLGVAHD